MLYITGGDFPYIGVDDRYGPVIPCSSLYPGLLWWRVVKRSQRSAINPLAIPDSVSGGIATATSLAETGFSLERLRAKERDAVRGKERRIRFQVRRSATRFRKIPSSPPPRPQ